MKPERSIVRPDSRNVGFCLVLLFSFLAVCKFFPVSSGKASPGHSRGDLCFAKEDLPEEIAGWRLIKFVPPVLELERRGGAWWSSHQWIYERNGQQAIVSLDQLGESRWHELTHCYRNLDYAVSNREVCSGDTGYYVVADLQKPNDDRWLVYCSFSLNGYFLRPPEVNLSALNQLIPRGGAIQTLQRRLTPFMDSETANHGRVLQCQVVTAADETQGIQPTLELHRMAREQLFLHSMTQCRGKDSSRNSVGESSPESQIAK